MALISPYTILVKRVRLEVGDKLSPPNQLYTDDEIVEAINSAVTDRVNADVGTAFVVDEASQLLNPDILGDRIYFVATIYAAAMVLLNLTLQKTIIQDVAISKGTTKISVDPKVRALERAIEQKQEAYSRSLVQNFGGVAQFVQMPEE